MPGNCRASVVTTKAFGQVEVAVLEHRHHAVGIERGVWLLIMGSFEDIDRFLIALDPALGDEQPHGTARSGNRMHVELHGFTLPTVCCPSFARKRMAMGLIKAWYLRARQIVLAQ